SESNWANYLVCRTGPATLNTRIASLAQARGLKWNPYGSGFLDQANGRDVVVTTEEEVFAAVGLPCLPPEQRDQQ
ncbi:MAG: DNA polymerase/3'-5' exonuclease PolX, partial [Limisphaerales bacterium]